MKTSMPKVAVDEQLICVQTRGASLDGTMVIPPEARSIAIFVQAEGSCRHNPRNHYLAHFLRHYGLATLLVDLLTLEEQMLCSRSECLHFDIKTLAMRLVEVTDWLHQNSATQHLEIGYVGLHQGSRVACLAAIERPEIVRGIVAPGNDWSGLDLALPHVKAPTLLIVGGFDNSGLLQAQRVLSLLPSNSHLAIVPRSDSMFRDSSNLEMLGQLTSQWFKKLNEEV
jgi:putative phosphoribosyl transferase